MRRTGLVAGVLVLLAAFAYGEAPAASAASKTGSIEFGTINSVARASNGDTVLINGSGTFSLQPKSVSGSSPLIEAAFGAVPRTFTHRDARGNVIATGTWEPTEVLSYRSFGPATAAQSAFFGGLPAGSEGGKLMIKVALSVGSVHVHDGILTIVCELGQPPKNSVETTLLLVQGTPFNFRQVVSGDNIFIRE